WVDGPTRSPDQVPARIRDLVREMDLRAMRCEAAAEGKAELLPPERPAAGRLGEVCAPTLVMWGDLDAPITLSSSPALAAGIPGAAHLPNLEQPEKFNEIVLDFLKGL